MESLAPNTFGLNFSDQKKKKKIEGWLFSSYYV